MSEETKVVSKNKVNKKFLFGATILITLALLAVLVIFVPKSANAKKASEQLSLGDKYLSELQYEQAEAAYLAVIEIDSKNVDAYLGLADAYVAQGEYDKAIAVLEDALEKLDGNAEEAVKDKLTEVQSAKAAAEVTPTVAPTSTPTPEPTPTSTPTTIPEKSASVVPENLIGQTGVEGILKYEFIVNGLLIIGVTDSNETEIFIPEDIMEYPIIGIGDYAFRDSKITKIVFPEGLESIGLCAFMNCNGLTEITIPDSVEVIWAEAFAYCNNLKKVYLPENIILLGGNIFKHTSWLESKKKETTDLVIINSTIQDTSKANGNVIIPEGVIGMESAFSFNNNITSVTVPGTLVGRNSGAFYSCKGLKTVILLEGVKELESSMFFECTALEKVIIPDSVQYVSSIAFLGCNVENITIVCSEGHTMLETLKKIGFTKFEHTLGWESVGATSTPMPEPIATSTPAPTATSTPVPTATPTPAVEGNVRVELKMASDCFTYEMVDYEYVCSGLSEKGYAEFCKYGKSNLVSIKLPEASDTGKEVVGFYSKSKGGYDLKELLTAESAYVELVCPENYTIYYGVCDERPDSKYAGKLVNVVLNEGMEEIGQYAFYGCTSLEELVLPSSLEKLNGYAFAECTGLKTVEIPESVTAFGSGVFSGCEKLEIEEFEMGGKKIGGSAFNKVHIDKLTMSEPIADASANGSAVGGGSFMGADIGEVIIADGVKEIADYTFRYCDSITEVKIPDSIEVIGDFAFENCNKLKTVEIPESVKEFGSGAFSNCENLVIEEFEMGGKKIGGSAFNKVHIDKLTMSEPIADASANGSAVGGGSFMGADIGEVIIADGVKEIADYTFRYCDSITEMKIPDSVEVIGNYAFECCNGLERIIIPASIREMGHGVFRKCKGLVIITPNDSCAEIYAIENNIPVQNR